MVFIDETWAKTNMTRRHGHCRRGARLVAKVPHGRWRTLTFLAALRHDRITAPCVIDGPINGASFRAYIEQFLVPTPRPGDVVVMDNLGSHRGQGVRRLIRAAGAKLFFLARYSPDLNPIEQVFAKLKTLLRKTDPRTIEATWRSIGSLLERFTPQHALAATPSLFSDALPISKSYMGRQCAYDTEFTTTEYVLVSIRAMAAGNSEPLTWLLYCSLIGSGWQGFAGWAVASETPKLLLSRNTLSTEEQVKIGQILIGLSVLPLLAGAATAAQPTLLSDTQMDKVTAGDNELPAGFVTSTIQITTARGFIPVQIKYAIFPVCDTCSPTAALANAALAALLPPNP